MAVHCCQMMGKREINACYNMVTWGGAKTLALKAYGLAVGNPANVVVLDATNRFDAIRKRSIARYVISRGKMIVENEPALTKVIP
jgi:cytosine deaminase